MASITTKSNISGRAAMLAKIKMAQIEKNKIQKKNFISDSTQKISDEMMA